ncbi:signal peptidase I [Candidatus Saccharibacteria bacterium]|nr:signal peptidase I [Candidatus Saccharibacteria bacterium]
MWRRLRSVKPTAWWLLLLVVCVVGIPVVLKLVAGMSGSVVAYIVQPFLAVTAGIVTRVFIGGRRDRMRHKAERSLIIGSVMAVWFVAYFASGLIVTFSHNAVASSWQAIVINLAAFGVTAVAIEYVRHGIMVAAGRRSAILFGVIVGIVFACEQVGLMQIFELHTVADVVKFSVSSVVPAIASSFLLTYLAFNAGLEPQLTYRLGLIAILYMPAIIPRYDWYLTGIAWLVLAIAVYITIDRTRKELAINGRQYRHARRAYDVMFLMVIVVGALFMIGTFSYRPIAIMSNSMHPVFDRGAIVIIEKAIAMDVKVGDIVQYKAPGHMTTHRVIKIDFDENGSGKRVFITQGDNSPSPDPVVKSDQIVGIIRAQVPYVGYPSVWLSEFIR